MGRAQVLLPRPAQPKLCPALLLGAAVAATHQLVGVNVVIYYAPTILKQAGMGDFGAVLSSVGICAMSIVFTTVALLLVDRMNRRPLLIGRIGVVISVLFGLNAMYLMSNVDEFSLLLTAGLMVYETAFATSLELAIWLINSEAFPTAVCGKAAGDGTVTHWVLDFFLSISVLTLIDIFIEIELFWVYWVLVCSVWRTCTETCPKPTDVVWRTSKYPCAVAGKASDRGRLQRARQTRANPR